VVSSRDISQSSIEALSRSSSSLRLLRLCLTDGYSEIVAIEYNPIPALHDDIVPGTKVRLENKPSLHGGIVCLNPRVVTVLGGVVQTLYDEWEMNRKYSGFSRSTLRLAQRSDSDGPPPFEKLRIDTHSQKTAQQHTTFPREAVSNNPVPAVKAGASSDFKEIKGKNPNLDHLKNDIEMKAAGLNGQKEEKPSSSESRPKEVSEAVPVQNQAAAQKLLQKMSQPSRSDQHFPGSKHRGRGRQEEPAVFTLEEWQKRKNEVRRPTRHDIPDIYDDEELARQLQEQLDLEDFQVSI
ncbi:Tudor domain protein, partial [Thalictrum thalictroides]